MKSQTDKLLQEVNEAYSYLRWFAKESSKMSPLAQVAIDPTAVMARGKKHIEKLLEDYNDKTIRIKKLEVHGVHYRSLYEDLIEIQAEDCESLYEPEPPAGFEEVCRISQSKSPFIQIDPEDKKNLLKVEEWKAEDDRFHTVTDKK